MEIFINTISFIFLSGYMKKKVKISRKTYSQPVFFSEQIMQKRYDMEIDEGMSSGMKRYVTLDVTELSKRQVKGVLEDLLVEFEDFSVCKIVQIAGFNKNNKRYIIVSGESHFYFVKSTQELALGVVDRVVDGLPVRYIDEYVPLPVKGEPYKPINLGPYGSTGNPTLGIPQDPEAELLRRQGMIR